MSLVVGTPLPVAALRAACLTPLPATNPATISVNEWSPAELPGATALDSRFTSSAELEELAAPPGPVMPPPPFATAAATAAAE